MYRGQQRQIGTIRFGDSVDPSAHDEYTILVREAAAALTTSIQED